MREESGSQRRGGAIEPQQSFGMLVLRLWMWAVPILMLVAALLFGAIAAADGRWGLLFVMIVMGLMGLGLFVFHWWVLNRFGRKAR